MTGGLILFLAYVFIFGPQGYLRRRQKQEQISQLKSEIKRTKEEIKFLEKEAQDLEKENSFQVIREAREVLRMVQPGEYPVEFVNETGKKE